MKGLSLLPVNAEIVSELAGVKDPDTTLVTSTELPPWLKYDFTAIEVKNSCLLEPEVNVVPKIF